VFFGTSAFAVPSLEAVAQSTECMLAITQPDRPAGRGQRLHPTPVKRRALELGVVVAEPVRIRDVAPSLERIGADVFVVASYGKILPQALLDVPALGALNVHPSLLPLYRGATPLQSQLRDGVTEGGVTIILMDAGMDTGDIVLRRAEPIGSTETYGELHDRFAKIGAQMLETALAQAAAGTLERHPQNGFSEAARAAATVTRPLTKSDLEIDWSWSAKRVLDHIRSLVPEPLARAPFEGIDGLVKIAQASSEALAGESSVLVRCGDGQAIAIERLIPPNRGSMTGAEFERLLARTP
jgi:methionyl-tRNA formyltransferase